MFSLEEDFKKTENGVDRQHFLCPSKKTLRKKQSKEVVNRSSLLTTFFGVIVAEDWPLAGRPARWPINQCPTQEFTTRFSRHKNAMDNDLPFRRIQQLQSDRTQEWYTVVDTIAHSLLILRSTYLKQYNDEHQLNKMDAGSSFSSCAICLRMSFFVMMPSNRLQKNRKQKVTRLS